MTDIFNITMPLWAIVARGTIVYVGIFALLRAIPKRNAGHISPNDLLTLIIVGALGTDAIMGGSDSLADIMLMIVVVVGWSYAFDLLEYHFPSMRRLLRHQQTTLIKHGRLVRRNMRQELVTEQELMAELRKQGLDEVSQVRSAYLEADGEISLLLEDDDQGSGPS